MKAIVVSLVLLSSQFAFAAHEMITVSVNGMVCDFCAQGVKKQFNKMETVGGVEVDFEGPKNKKGESEKLVLLHMKEGKTLSDAVVKEKIEDAGFKVIEIRRSEMK